MKKKLQLLMAAFFTVAVAACAQGPNGSGQYYASADGYKGEALKTKLSGIISKKNSLSYDDLLELYKKTDTRSDGCVRDWYSNTTHFKHITDKAGSYKKEGDVYNREHSVPQSWGAPKADIVHVIPADGYVNNRRSNLPFGEVGTPTYESNNGYSKVGPSKTPGYGGTVFEPNDEVKGDLARIYFYMATCYENSITGWSGGGVINGTKYQPFAQWTFDMLVRWSRLDPVDDVERQRNNAIAATNVQGNRNPFVDYPGLEDYIWGSRKEVAFSYDDYEGANYDDQTIVEPPVFSPNGGSFTDQVTITMTSSTDGADIYYTTNGAEVSEQSKHYEGPVTLSESCTVKAIAVKDGVKSFQTVAEYRVVSSQTGTETPADGTILLGNDLFGTNYEGSMTNSDDRTLSGTQDGVTVVYARATGNAMYCNDNHIRLYAGNTLTLSVAQGELTEIEFSLATSTTKPLQASVGDVSDLTWRGKAREVVFTTSSGSGHLRLKSARVVVGGVTAIDGTVIDGSAAADAPLIDLQGRRVEQPTHGLYIRQGRKVLVR